MIERLGSFIFRIGAGFALFLEREAGYELVSLFLIGVGSMLMQMHDTFGHDLQVFALGVLARSMGTKKQAPPQ